VIQKVEEQSDASDLMQRWENGSDYIFLESPDEQEELASYLKDREAEGEIGSLTLRDFQPELRLSQIDANRRNS
jgi:hypothetical protein